MLEGACNHRLAMSDFPPIPIAERTLRVLSPRRQGQPNLAHLFDELGELNIPQVKAGRADGARPRLALPRLTVPPALAYSWGPGCFGRAQK